MNEVLEARKDAVTIDERADARKVVRSPILNQLRLNPFRILRLPVEAGVDEAIWKAEEALTLQRAGLSLSEPEILPWLPAPDDQEIRQAVQCIEEPLRRILEQVSWFDFQADPAGEDLQQALSSVETEYLNKYMARAGARDSMAVQVNNANLRLMLAALALVDALPPEWAGTVSDSAQALETFKKQKWEKSNGLQTLPNPHDVDLTDGRRQSQIQIAKTLWRNALVRWSNLLKSPDFQEYLKSCLTRLGDDSVGAEDAETLVNSLSTRLTDLLAGEMKIQVLAGRLDWVQALLSVAVECGIDQRQWILALRPLRPLFRTEVADLDTLLGSTEKPKLDDVELYLGRLQALTAKWAELDPTGLLSLDEFTDAAFMKVNSTISSNQDSALSGRMTTMLENASQSANAGSVKQRITATINRLNSQEQWLCHYCKTRDADVKCSVMLKGKKETGRTRYGNTTTIYYSIKQDLVQRCPRCADLHMFLRSVGTWSWLACGPFMAAFLYFNTYWIFGPRAGLFCPAVTLAVWFAASYFLVAKLLRGVAAYIVTPKDERHYWDVSSAKGYKTLTGEGYYEIAKDFNKGAFDKAVKGS